MFLLTTVVQKAAARGLHAPGGGVELCGLTTSRAQESRISSLFLLVYLSELSRPLFTYLQDLYYRENNKISLLDISLISEFA